MKTYCLFYNMTKREKLTRVVQSVFRCRVIAPKIIQRKWIKGTPYEEIHDFMPGYLFVYSDAAIEDPEQMAELDGVYRILGTKQGDWLLTGADREFAEMLFHCDGTIGTMKARRENGRVKLASGLFERWGAEIIKIDRRQRALVRYIFDGQECAFWVGYDLVEDWSSGEGLAAL